MNSTPLALIVDDDITLRVLAREALEQAGCRVEDAATGQEALEAFQRETPDIILLDVVMPGKDGLQLAGELQRLPCAAALRIIVMTSLLQRGHAERARSVGAKGYLTKPVRHEIGRAHV